MNSSSSSSTLSHALPSPGTKFSSPFFLAAKLSAFLPCGFAPLAAGLIDELSLGLLRSAYMPDSTTTFCQMRVPVPISTSLATSAVE